MYEIKVMLSRVSWELAQIYCFVWAPLQDQLVYGHLSDINGKAKEGHKDQFLLHVKVWNYKVRLTESKVK